MSPAIATPATSARPVRITLYRWGGQWGPFKVSIPCGECALTRDVIADTLATELSGIPVEVETFDWLSNWWKPIWKGGWHAPIVLVDGEIIAQGHALNRGLLTEAVIKAHAGRTAVTGTQVFGKAGCPHCVRARSLLEAAGIPYAYHDVVKEPRALYEMISRVKPIVGPHTPITVPQIWRDGAYVGGADALARMLAPREPDSMSASPASAGASLQPQLA